MTDISKATPRPWRVDVFQDEDYDPYRAEILAADGYTVLERETLEETAANAELIVRAVNSHEQLVAALEQMLSFTGAHRAGWLCRDYSKCGKCATCNAEKAIAAAKPSPRKLPRGGAMKSSEILREALKKFGENGENWRSGRNNGEYCSWGGIFAVVYGSAFAPWGAADQWAQKLGFNSAHQLFGWNDSESRTFPEVKAAFLKAIELAEAAND